MKGTVIDEYNDLATHVKAQKRFYRQYQQWLGVLHYLKKSQKSCAILLGLDATDSGNQLTI